MPTIDPSMSLEAYHASAALSSGALRRILKSPAHYRAWKTAPQKSTPAQMFGTAVHTSVLELDSWGSRIVEVPRDAPDKRTKAGQVWWERFYLEAGRRIQLTHEQVERINAIRCSVINTAAAASFLHGGRVEESHFWKETIDGREIEQRARPDFCVNDYKIVVDLKTAADASRSAFQRSVWTYRYDIQAAHYLDGLLATTGTLPHSYLWCVVETEAPYAVAWYRAEQSMLELARMDMARAKSIYVRCLTSNEWPGYPDEIQPLDLPRWAAATVEPTESTNE